MENLLNSDWIFLKNDELILKINSKIWDKVIGVENSKIDIKIAQFNEKVTNIVLWTTTIENVQKFWKINL